MPTANSFRWSANDPRQHATMTTDQNSVSHVAVPVTPQARADHEDLALTLCVLACDLTPRIPTPVPGLDFRALSAYELLNGPHLDLPQAVPQVSDCASRTTVVLPSFWPNRYTLSACSEN